MKGPMQISISGEVNVKCYCTKCGNGEFSIIEDGGNDHYCTKCGHNMSFYDLDKFVENELNSFDFCDRNERRKTTVYYFIKDIYIRKGDYAYVGNCRECNIRILDNTIYSVAGGIFACEECNKKLNRPVVRLEDFKGSRVEYDFDEQ